MIGLWAGLLLQGAALADDSGVLCVLGGLDAAARATIVADFEAGRSGPGSPGWTVVDAAVDACAARGSWTDDDSANRGAAAMALVVREAEGRILDRAGIAPAQIEAAFARLEPGLLAATTTDAGADAIADRIMADLAAHGIAADIVERNLDAIDLYVGATIALALFAPRPHAVT
jgi:hypothetical protein